MEKDIADWQNDQTKYMVEKAWPMSEDQAGAVYSESHEFSRSSDPGHKYAILAQFQAKRTKTPQGWRFLEFQEISIQATKDGQPLSPKSAKQAIDPWKIRAGGKSASSLFLWLDLAGHAVLKEVADVLQIAQLGRLHQARC